MVDPLSGGPAGFPQLLARQASVHLAQLPAVPTGDPGWILVEEGFTLAREHEVELLFAIGNGYAGSRGSLAEGSALSAPATFVAGVFDFKARLRAGACADCGLDPSGRDNRRPAASARSGK